MLRGIRLLLTTAAVTLAAVAVNAEITVKNAVRSMPYDMILPLSQSTLSDLIEYYEAAQYAKTLPNEFKGEARIKELGPTHAVIQTGTARELTLILLETKSDTVYAVIETLETPTKDSRLSIFSSDWQPSAKLWKEPKAKDWLNSYGKKNRKAFEQEVPYILAEYDFDPESGILTLTNRSKENKFMRSALRYKWTAKGFKLLKE